MQIRPRRLRTNQAIRQMVRETRLAPASLILPLFIKEGANVQEEISALPGHRYYSPDNVQLAAENALKQDIKSIILFGIPQHKDELASGAYAADGVVQQAIRSIKKHYPELTVITDVCLCEYTANGHCGFVRGHEVLNDPTLPYLAQTALSHVEAGADIVAPSDMMDGRVAAIRDLLDTKGFENIPILSYSAKYSSAFYGPFRDVAGSAPSFGDRKSYQMDYHNKREALKEALLDVSESADMLMVKPALSYLDVISEVKQATNLPLCAYSVSGEYAMIKAAAKMGCLDEYSVMCETAVSIFRAGADMLITYYAPELAAAIKKGDIG